MIAVTYCISLQEPLLATALSGEPNSAVSYPYIPGSMIRGLVAGRYGAAHPGEDLAVAARALLFDGQVRYLNAYPADDQDRRCLPVPFSWRKEKTRRAESGRVEDFALLPPLPSEFAVPQELDGFTRLEGERFVVYHPSRQINVHTLRDRFAGRPTESRGAVYRYDALAAGETFIGVVITPTVEAARDWVAGLPAGEYRLGGAATGGYGLLRLTYPGGPLQTVRDPWHEYDAVTGAIDEGEEFVVTLLSDALLRDENGAGHTDLLRALGWPVEEVRAFKKAAPVGGFNRHWGLPLPQALALRAGSVVVFRATADISRAQVEALLAEGVGERRVEGFGRLAINWQCEPVLVQEGRTDPQPQVRPVTLPDDLQPLARRMATRRRRLELDRDLVAAINRLRGLTRRLPPNSQLSRVRVIARSALAERDLMRISDLFKPGEKNPRAMKGGALKKFEAARVGGQRLSDWIIELADHPETIWEQFRGGRQAQPLGDVEPEGWLAEEYAVRLIDGVLGAAMAARRGGGD